MPAGVGVQGRTRGLPAGIPDGIPVLYVEIMPPAVRRAVVVAVAGEPHELRVFVEAISSRCV